MKIRGKLLILLLLISLVPLIVGVMLHRISMFRLGEHLSQGIREMATENAYRSLQKIVKDYEEILQVNKKTLEMTIMVQALEVEKKLALKAEGVSEKLSLGQYGFDESIPAGIKPFFDYMEEGPDGKKTPMPIDYRRQGYFLAGGVTREKAEKEMKLLSSMTNIYRNLAERNPNLILWQYTTLESGLHTNYPYGGSLPGADEYDPRQRQWYVGAKKKNGPVWHLPAIDASTQKTIFTISMPVRFPDGSFAGVTAIDMPISVFMDSLNLPEQWGNVAEFMLVRSGREGTGQQGKPVIIVHKDYQDLQQSWKYPVQLQVLQTDEPEKLQALIKNAESGNSGISEMRYRGQNTLWAYSFCNERQPLPILVVPYEKIVARANKAEQYIRNQVFEGLKITGFIMIGVVSLSIFLTFFSARCVTQPVKVLAQAAQKIARGDYRVRVSLRTRDELQELGETFNDMGNKLEEREKMKRSLALAMAIQQNLLPRESPSLEHFEITGQCLYCDETGGDYYDFIDLVEINPHRTGIAVGDITGHGIGAALLMAAARGVFRSHAIRYGGELTRLFDEINAHMLRDTSGDRFMTLFYGIIDDQDRSLIWASGGHDPVLWYHNRNGEIEELPNTGLPLGVVKDTSFEQKGPITVQSGDVLLVGTDGIWETRNEIGEMFGKERMREIIRARHEETALSIHAAIINELSLFRGKAQQLDDITLIVIKGRYTHRV